jgi:polysaccharide export outer membrane protein
MKKLFSCLSWLAIACLVGCATKPTTGRPANYSDLSQQQAASQPQPQADAARLAPNTTTGPATSNAPKTAIANATTTATTEKIDPQLLRPSVEPFTLGPGDSMELEILGTPASRTTTTVGLDGKIYFNLLPGLDVWGLSLDQTRDLMERELGKFLSAPQVSISLRAVGSRYVWLLGRLNRPGIYPLAGTMTLLESLALAGGTARSGTTVSTEELADLRHSFVMRQGKYLPVDFKRLLLMGDMSQNIYMEPDDFVYVPSALMNEIYVLGAVRTPRALPYQDPMTLVSAVLGADGPAQLELLARDDGGPFMPDARLSHITILRGSLVAPQVTIVDFQAIVKGKAPDVRLEPGDIIYVPNSLFTNVKRYLNMAVTSFVSTVAANEGLRAAGGNIGVNVSVPLALPQPTTPSR